MISAYGPFRSRLVCFSIACALLLGSGNAAAITPANHASQVARLGQEFKLGIGRQATLKREGLLIKFVKVKEDSRCPADVQCIWAGNAAVQLQVSMRGRSGKSLTLNSDSAPASVGEDQYRGYKFKLVDLSPYPRSRKGKPQGYVATLLVSKSDAANSASQ